jgi:hypothetical protein
MADFQITLNVPEQHVNRVEAAINGQAGKRLELESVDRFSKRKFHYDPRGETENKRDYFVRVIETLVRALVRVHEYAESQDEYNVAMLAIEQPTEDVPEGIIM